MFDWMNMTRKQEDKLKQQLDTIGTWTYKGLMGLNAVIFGGLALGLLEFGLKLCYVTTFVM